LVILLAGALLPPLDFFIVNVALPSIREDFQAFASTMQLIISGYATTYAVMLITGGRLGDLYGRRNVFLSGMAGFAAASALCGFAWAPSVLIVGRVLQGLAAAI
jgi:MFS family permease